MSAGSLSRHAYLAAGTPLIVLCATFVAIRCFMSFRLFKRLLIDDYISIVGLIFVTVAFAMNDLIIRRFLDPTAPHPWLVKLAVVITVVIAFVLWTTKAPILVVYLKIFNVTRWLVYACYATLTLSGIAYICALSPTFMRCHPSSKSIPVEELLRCVSGTTLTGVISGYIALFQDVIILLLPMPSIYGLHLRLSKKLAIGAVFASGILAIAASIVSLYFKYRAHTGESENLARMLCAVIEGTIAVMVGCAPSAKNFWKTFLSPRRYKSTEIPTHMRANISPLKHASQQSEENELRYLP
ncbi:hypothetical protein PT974_00318 [Cladobotryum mycophilum]|uniref:Rhodopsin domain-containing protein n=1 Tax=Cladobotryum mycophilum TaxID=491253 RepID=A0ABR0T1Q2_9HYPO